MRMGRDTTGTEITRLLIDSAELCRGIKSSNKQIKREDTHFLEPGRGRGTISVGYAGQKSRTRTG
jgi:hypothetical protein